MESGVDASAASRGRSASSRLPSGRTARRGLSQRGDLRLPIDLRRVWVPVARGDGLRSPVDRGTIVVAPRDWRRCRALLRAARCERAGVADPAPTYSFPPPTHTLPPPPAPP